jgi:DNA repair exonuclease SbcCD ATPase subunit
MLYVFKAVVDEVKEKIVRQKLDTLFDYVSDKVAAERFKKEVENYNFESSVYAELLQSFNEKYYSKTKQDAIVEKTKNINELIDQYNSIIDDYKNNMENMELLRDAVRLQIRSITPEMENLRRLKNELNEVIVDIDTVGNTSDIKSTLVQRKVTLAGIDVTLEEPPRVVKFSKKA